MKHGERIPAHKRQAMARRAYALRLGGATWPTIEVDLDISEPTARNLVAAGRRLNPNTKPIVVVEAKRTYFSTANRVVTAFDRNPSATSIEIGAMLGLHPAYVRVALRRNGRTLARARAAFSPPIRGDGK